MKRGDQVLLKRGRTRKSCEVVHDHSADTPPFPALTIKYNGSEWIVGIHEVVTPEEIEAERIEKKRQAAESVADIVSAYAQGNESVSAIATFLQKSVGQIVSKARKAERMGLITLKRKGQP